MQTRKFGNLNFDSSILGFGTMRLPVIGGDSSKIDEDQAIAMIRYAIDHGVNYVDSAHGYHGGNSEVVTGKALSGGYRERVKIATKQPPWSVHKASDMDRLLDQQLQRLQTNKIDVYLLHCLSKSFWQKLSGFGVVKWAENMIAKGRIGGLGFSAHETCDDFCSLIDAYDGWAMCQIQYNYLDQENQAGTRGLLYAGSKGVPVVAMEPLRGGRLAEPPAAVRAVFDGVPARRSPVEWALRWVWNHPEIKVALSGMSRMAQVKENLAIAERFAPMTADESAVIDRAVVEFEKAFPVACTACGYCMPCPKGVNIPRVFDVYNQSVLYADLGVPRYTYGLIPASQRADQCAECHECEPKCPQKIAIPQELAAAHKRLG
ncbi:MAG TPA: aldo/keto reductase [Planctomycetota bacterium]|jgi:hypothetical protein